MIMNTTFCVKCRHSLSQTDSFCSFCGTDQRLTSQAFSRTVSAVPAVAQAGQSAQPGIPIAPVAAHWKRIAVMWVAFVLNQAWSFFSAYRMVGGIGYQGAWGVLNLVALAAWLTSVCLAITLVTGRTAVGKWNGGIVLALHLVGLALAVFFIFRMFSHMSLIG